MPFFMNVYGFIVMLLTTESQLSDMSGVEIC